MTAVLPGRADEHAPVNPLPVGPRLPGVFLEDEFVQRFCAALDEVLAPDVLTLDSLPAHFDPITTPRHVLPWLADWLGLALDPRQSTAQQRHLVRKTARMLRWRGTARGLRDEIEFLTGVRPEIIETGAADWSATAGTVLPGEAGNAVIVRLRVGSSETIDVSRVEHLVATAVPAHLACTVDVVVEDTP